MDEILERLDKLESNMATLVAFLEDLDNRVKVLTKVVAQGLDSPTDQYQPEDDEIIKTMEANGIAWDEAIDKLRRGKNAELK